ncbi:MAG TPA: MarR family transcriptional regulator [Trueperaceae bacterium]|nr:MarR family transcriptional regulator [Trueperaceae bacterium]
MATPERILATRGCLCLGARRTARLLTRHYDEHLRPTGLRATQFSILAALANTGGATMTRLADLLGLERTTLTRSAGLLEEKGWVTSTATGDARERQLALTAAGEAQLERSLPAWEAAQAAAPALLSGTINLPSGPRGGEHEDRHPVPELP